ncbi:MAG: CHAT domain-containing protein [Gammaproteobacteria bacterium]
MKRPLLAMALVAGLLSTGVQATECEEYLPNQASRLTIELMESAQRAALAGEPDLQLAFLEKAYCAASQSIDKGDLIAANAAVGRALVAQGSLTSAYPYLRDGAELAEQTGREAEAAALFNDLGILEESRGKLSDASRAFTKSSELALTGSELKAVASINLARVKIENEGLRAARQQFAIAQDDVNALPDGSAKAGYLLSLGESQRIAAKLAGNNAELGAQALATYKQAIAMAEASNNQVLIAYGLGYTSRLYRDQNDLNTALGFSRRAVVISQQADSVEGEFQWQWESGQTLREADLLKLTAVSYELASGALRRMGERYGEFTGQQFNELVRPFYLEYTDILLTTSKDMASKEQQDSLEFVLTLLDEVKVAETQEYFEDACVITAKRDVKQPELSANVSVITPIVFKDRIEVLTRIDNRVQRHSAAVKKRQLRRTVNSFRRGIVERDSALYKENGQKLYDWLVAPQIEAMRAANIDTFVFVPDDAFLSIPPAAMYDGEKFLIEEFAVSSVLSLSQTNLSTDEQVVKPKALVSGLTESVQGFDALPAVESEIQKVSANYNSTVYQDGTFQKSTLQKELADNNYSIVHVATHAQFQSDYRESFLLTHDGKIPMNELDQAIRKRADAGNPLDLIVLSSCETAVGDNLAALGLAGITVKAGAKSSIASLWPVNDTSTSEFMQELYSQLSKPEVGKANAVRSAQLKLLESDEYQEPYYWAAFMLVGDWL